MTPKILGRWSTMWSYIPIWSMRNNLTTFLIYVHCLLNYWKKIWVGSDFFLIASFSFHAHPSALAQESEIRSFDNSNTKKIMEPVAMAMMALPITVEVLLHCWHPRAQKLARSHCWLPVIRSTMRKKRRRRRPRLRTEAAVNLKRSLWVSLVKLWRLIIVLTSYAELLCGRLARSSWLGSWKRGGNPLKHNYLENFFMQIPKRTSGKEVG